MSVFGAYSKYYNLLYKDKDYAGEARYIHELIQQHTPGAKSVLDLGCGTGRHDFELAKLGYDITGVDLSEEMLASANARLSSLISHQVSAPSSTLNSHPSTDSSLPHQFIKGDIRTVRLDQIFDVVVSLFHVMSYQITNADLQSAMATAKTHLKPGGLFIFDCWYGPAVLSDPPVVRVKRLEDDEISVIRIAEPVMHYNENVVEVKYEMLIVDKASGTLEKINEIHRMRYLFLPEIESLSKRNGFESVSYEEFMTTRCPGKDTWGVVNICKAAK